MAINVQYNDLDEINGSIRLEINGTADFITARRVSDSTVDILDLVVADANQKQGFGRELVEELLKLLPYKVTTAKVKTNDNPSFWQYAKNNFDDGDKISL